MRRRISRGLRTGAKQSDVFQSCGSRLPRTTIRYFALEGMPFSSNFTLDRAMVGSGLPRTCLRVWYSASVM